MIATSRGMAQERLEQGARPGNVRRMCWCRGWFRESQIGLHHGDHEVGIATEDRFHFAPGHGGCLCKIMIYCNMVPRKAVREEEAGLIEAAIIDERLMELDHGTDDESHD